MPPPFTAEEQRKYLGTLLIQTLGTLLRDILQFYFGEIRRSFRRSVLERHRRLFASEDDEEEEHQEEQDSDD